MILQVDPERCKRCSSCNVEVGCLGQVVHRADPQDPPVIDEERCYGCGLCTMICRHGAVVEKLRPVTKRSR